jgi:hypothetical protein
MKRKMDTATTTLRRWPERNFLAELEPPLRETNALDDVARRDPRLRRLQRRLALASRTIRGRVSSEVWVSFSDASLAVLSAEFELAFNLGFENGFLSGRTERTRSSRPPLPDDRFASDIRRLIAGTEAPRERLLGALLEVSSALAAGATAPRSPSRARRRT